MSDGFEPANGQDILQRDELTVGTGSGPATLAEDRPAKDVGNDPRLTLLGADALRAGREATRTFRAEDPRTGEGVRDMRPYLGAAAHVVILSQHAFRASGLYKVWGQFQDRHGQVLTAAFVVRAD